MQRRREKGFTLVELLVTLAVAGVLLGIIYAIFITQRRAHIVQEQVAEMQQNARIATDELTRSIQAIGNGVDQFGTPPQGQLHVCGPYELLFDSDMDGVATDALANGSLVTSLYHAPGQNYTVPGTFSRAETYRYALVANGSRHFDLVRTRFYTDAGANHAQTDVIAQNLIGHDLSGNAAPLFVYWIDDGSGSGLRLWGDTDSNGRLDATEAAAVGPVSVSGKTLDQVLRRIQIQVTAETKNADTTYLVNAGYRQNLVVSNVTPRNLWACPVITGPGAQTLKAPAIGGATTPFSFPVTYLGGPEPGRRVNFSLTGPGVSSGMVTYNTTFNTGSNGMGVASVSWPACVGLKNLFAASSGANLVYTLTATIGQPPSLSTPFGVCAAQSISIQITVTPGDASSVQRTGGPTGGDLTTCGGTADLTYQVQDGCGTPLPWTNAQFFAKDTTSPGPKDVGDFANVVVSSTYPYEAQITYRAPNAGGTWPSPRYVGNDVPVDVWAADGALASTATRLLLAARPATIFNLSNDLASAANTDCTNLGVDVTGTFQLRDCRNHTLSGPQTLPIAPDRYEVVPSITSDLNGPQLAGKQGTVAPNPITTIDGSHLLSFTYTPPDCTLGPGVSLSPTLKLDLKKNTSAIDTALQPFPLRSCDNCALVANPATLNKCWSSTKLTVSRCGRGWLNQQVTFTVRNLVSGSGNGSFDSTYTNVTTTTVRFEADPTNPDGVVASATLYLGTAVNGSSLQVTAASVTMNATNSPIWSCSLTDPIQVSTTCYEVRLYTLDKNGNKKYVGNEPGQTACLSGISELWFEVTDCQSSLTSVPVGNQAIRVYAISADGRTLDREYVELRADPLPVGESAPQKLRSVRGLPIQKLVGAPVLGNETLTYPPGNNVILVVGYKDPTDPYNDNHWGSELTAPVTMPVTVPSGDKCQKVLRLTVPLPICFPNAITSGGGGLWNGNFKVHWGDVVIRGSADPGSGGNVNKRITKTESAPLVSGGTAPLYGSEEKDWLDRFFDIYVGYSLESVANDGFLLGGEGLGLQPFVTEGFGNYFQTISNEKITSMIQTFEYPLMKTLAMERGAYWYTLSDGSLRNPSTKQGKDPVTGEGTALSLETVLSLTGGPGTRNAYYDGQYIFIDTFGDSDTGTIISKDTIRGDATSSMPSFTVTGIYTEGIIYIAGSVLVRGPGGFPLVVSTPPDVDTRYDYVTNGSTGITQYDLPIQPRSLAPTVDNVRLQQINLNGGLYTVGTMELRGNPTIFGSLTAERGYLGDGTGELWYNYDLNVGDFNESLCIACCWLGVDPGGATLVEGAWTQLTATRAVGVVSWESLDSSIASVDQTGRVTARALPSGVTSATTSIKLVDANNCVAYAQIQVIQQCSQFSVAPASPSPVVGSQFTITASGYDPTSSINWSWSPSSKFQEVGRSVISSTSSSLTLVPVDGGSGTVTVSDGNNRCSATPTATVNAVCPSLGVSFRNNPILSGGATTSVSLVRVLDDVPTILGPPTWSSSNTGAATITAGTSPGNPAGITSGSSSGQSTITAQLTPACAYTNVLSVSTPATCNLLLNPSTAQDIWRAANGVAGSVTLTASQNVGTVSWSPVGAGITLSNLTGTTTKVTAVSSTAATATVTATDAGVANCSRSVTINVRVPDCSGFQVQPATSTIAKNGNGQVTLTASDSVNGLHTINWTHSGSYVTLSAGTGTSVTARSTNGSAGKTEIVTATDQTTGCSASATVNMTN